MTYITRWDPFRDLQFRMNRMLGDYARGGDEGLTTESFMPAADVYEDDHNLVLKFEVPGMEEKDLDIRLENNILTLRGERKFEKEEKEENFHRLERRYGTFTRSFTLPNTVDTNNLDAKYEAGILKVTMPKRAEAKPKQVKINVGGPKTIEGKRVQAA